jgi:uracil-DNA glycosylase family 4
MPQRSGKQPNLYIIGEGPGRYEEIKGEPFIGPSGLLLNKMLQAANIDRAQAWVTNSTLCRPESDRDADAAACCCAPRLYKEIEKYSAPILCLGKPAARAVLGGSSILYMRGFIWTAPAIDEATISAARNRIEKGKLGQARNPWMLRLQCRDSERAREVALGKLRNLYGRSTLAGRTVLPTIHPAFVLRLETWKVVLSLDIKRAGRVLRGEVRQTADKGHHKIVSTPFAIRQALRTLGDTVGFDIETDGVHPLTTKVLCLGLSDGPRTFVIHPWISEQHRAVFSKFFHSGRTFVGHNAYAFDCPTLEKDGVKFNYRKTEDTLLAHHSFASHLPQRLDQVVSEYLDSAPWKIRFGRRGAEEKGLAPHQMPVQELALYNAADCRLTVRAWRAMQADLARELSIYRDDKMLARMCASMQRTGIAVDLERRAYLSEELRTKASRLLVRMKRLTGQRTFFPMKLESLRTTLFDKLGTSVIRYTPTGQASTGALVLQALRGMDTRAGKLAGLVLDYRSALKIRSAYLENLEIFADGRAHPNWKAFGTVSGRLSSRQQQLPRITNPKDPAIEDRVREIYVARKGCVIVHFDISQAEMRCAANLSGDPVFMKATLEKDMHAANAKLIFGNYPAALDALEHDIKGKGKPYRDISKSAGFAVNYLASDEALFFYLQSQPLPRPVTMPEVRRILAVLHVTFKVHFKYIAGNVAFVEKHGYFRSPIAGRIRWFGWHPKPTEVANFPVQSCVADVMNDRLPRLQKLVSRAIPKCHLIEQVHDAGDFECPKSEVNHLNDIIASVWEPDVVLPESGRHFKLPVDMKTGERLSEL